ncbi:MAG: hypothetical protein EBT15_12075 [Betaproteobacteria bacterium]|nr:hypothetical protein [Betaproteobacteria bacterium]
MYTAFVRSDLFHAGFSCDGQPFIAESYYVIIENEDGRRFRHEARFRSTKRVVDEETGDPCFLDLRDEASAKAEKLAERVNAALTAGRALNGRHWSEDSPAYGSLEYQRRIELQ